MQSRSCRWGGSFRSGSAGLDFQKGNRRSPSRLVCHVPSKVASPRISQSILVLLFTSMIQKAITIRQPLRGSSCMALSLLKTGQSMKVGGCFAGRSPSTRPRHWCLMRAMTGAAKKLGKKIPRDELHLGGIVGVAELYDIVDNHRSKWFAGPFALVLRNARPVEFIPINGQLGLWNLPARLRRRLD